MSGSPRTRFLCSYKPTEGLGRALICTICSAPKAGRSGLAAGRTVHREQEGQQFENHVSDRLGGVAADDDLARQVASLVLAPQIKIIFCAHAKRRRIVGLLEQWVPLEAASIHHSITPSIQCLHGSTNTGMPTQTICAKYSAFQFARRKQPCDSARPTCSGRGVPWMP